MPVMVTVSPEGVIGSKVRLPVVPGSADTVIVSARSFIEIDPRVAHAADGSGLEVSPYRLLQNRFVQSEIRYRPSQPGILLLQGLEPLGLFYL